MGIYRRTIDRLNDIFRTSKGKNIFLYLLFVLISFVFWLLLTLNNEVQKDYILPLNIKSIPDSTTMITDAPAYIRVSVKDKGSSLLKYSWGRVPSINIDFKEFSNNAGVLRVTPVELKSIIRDAMGGSVTIMAVNPDSLRLSFTNIPGKEVPLVLDVHAESNMQYVISGKIATDVNKVKIYSSKERLAEISEVYTYRIEELNLKDTLYRDVKIAALNGVKIVPERVKVMIPVEPLITKKEEIPISVTGATENVNVVIFPSKLEVTYLVPLSQYKVFQHIKAVANYDENMPQSKKLHVEITDVSPDCNNLSLSLDSVDYIIQRD